MGPLIKEKLRALKLTNAWLLEKLSRAGYTICREDLSRFINGKRKSDTGDKILAAAYDILCDYEETERLKACH